MEKLPNDFGEGFLNASKFWMAPDGIFYGLSSGASHPSWAARYLRHLKKPYNNAPDELYKKGWVRLMTGFDDNTYTLWYEHRYIPLSSKLKHEIKNLAIELRAMKIKDRNGDDYEFLPENKTIKFMKKDKFKRLIKEIIKGFNLDEVSQRDLKHRHPNNPAFFDKNSTSGLGGWDVDKLTLDNLMALKRKTRDFIAWLQKHPDERHNDWLKREQEQYKMISLEIQNRIDAINKPITENTIPEIKSKHFVIKFGEKDLPASAGKIFFGDVWFANAVKIENDWIPGHNGEWLINRHAGALQMGLPSVTEYFKNVPMLLNYLERWLQNSGNLREDLQQRHNQVGYQSQCTGISHGVSNDYNDVKLVRDPLNDPMLNGKLHESQYKFDDFKWLGRMDGFGVPTDVRHGTILLGVIVSQPNGYLISIIKGPNGDRSYRQDPKKPFKTKEEAATALHRAWKSLRHGEETKSL